MTRNFFLSSDFCLPHFSVVLGVFVLLRFVILLEKEWKERKARTESIGIGCAGCGYSSLLLLSSLLLFSRGCYVTALKAVARHHSVALNSVYVHMHSANCAKFVNFMAFVPTAISSICTVNKSGKFSTFECAIWFDCKIHFDSKWHLQIERKTTIVRN